MCNSTYTVGVKPGLFSAPLGPPAGLEVGPNPLPRALGVLGELARARVDDGLDLLLGLLGDRNMAVQVLVHEQSNEHLQMRMDVSG